jgi:histidinol-phosphate aminotransferase
VSVLGNDKIQTLMGDYTNFCYSVRFRETEGFYVDNFPIHELSYNENPLGPGSLALAALRRISKQSHRYPPLGYCELTEALAKKLRLMNENILVTPGSVTAVFLAVQQQADPGDKVIFSLSSLPWYRWSAVVNNSIPVVVPLANDMNHDLESILRQVDTKTRAVILSNPHNPTGMYITEDKIQRFHEKLPDNVLLIIDQAYYEYQTKQEEILINMVNKVSNLMLTRTFSKLHGLAGLRVGYAISNQMLIDGMKVKWLAFMPSISTAGAYAALHALDDNEHYQRSRSFNDEAKRSISDLANRYGLRCLKSEGNFLCINVLDSHENEKHFHANDIRLTAGYFFGYPEWVRISFVKDMATLEGRLEAAFRSICRERRT